MNISICSITIIIMKLLNTCIILVGGRSDLFNSGERWSLGGGGIFSKLRGELAKMGVKKFRGVGPWMKLCPIKQ